MTQRAVDLFAGGARGWDIHDQELGIHTLGYELDAQACATAATAGFPTVKADIRQIAPVQGCFHGLKGSPPCTTFSPGGSGSGVRDLEQVLKGMQQLYTVGRIPYDLFSDALTGLVLEPLRWAMAGAYDWIVLEQVRAVRPIWEEMASYLQDRGYKTWTGVLNSADYGVPQLRHRAILIASLHHQPERPPPTHYGQHVTMFEAIGRGLTDRPSPTITGGGTATGGAEPIAKFHARYTHLPTWQGSTDRLTVRECASLQSLPASHPWQGNLGQQFLQCGNAIPALMARAVLKEALGL